MIVDEQRQHVLCRFYKYKNKTTTVESDHNPLMLHFSFKWNQKVKVDRKEVFNVRNLQCQKIFTNNSSNSSNLIKVLENQEVSKGGAK